MEISNDGILCYGIDFGSDEDSDDFPLSEALLDDFEGVVYKALTGDSYDLNPDGYFERKRVWAATTPLSGVELRIHCSYDYGMWILTHKDVCFSASGGYPKEIDLTTLASQPPMETVCIKEVCELLDIPYSPPKWILTSVYG